MQLQAAVDDCRHGNQGAHVGVHLLVHQPEGQSFISNQSLRAKKNKKNTTGQLLAARQCHDWSCGKKQAHLVVAFCIGDAFLPVAPVGERVDDIANVPVLILYLLQDLHGDGEGLLNEKKPPCYDRCGSERSICALTDVSGSLFGIRHFFHLS